MIKNQVDHACTKHIDVLYHSMLDVIEEGELFKVHTTDNPAYTLTKVETRTRSQHCLTCLILVLDLHTRALSFRGFGVRWRLW